MFELYLTNIKMRTILIYLYENKSHLLIREDNVDIILYFVIGTIPVSLGYIGLVLLKDNKGGKGDV
tara:strand:+ start:3538 stop:3735 length:198 start_codon:yes stop_codon:yes gene_type:complete